MASPSALLAAGCDQVDRLRSGRRVCGIGDVPINEALGVLAQIVVRINGPLQDLKGDVLISDTSQDQPSAVASSPISRSGLRRRQ
jgi:hypothetical protein